jgi:hypothetical protein
MKGRRIVADVGGTNSRFGISAGPGDLGEVRVYRTSGEASFTDVLATYVSTIGAGVASSWCDSVCIAAAGPVDAGSVQLTNAAWSISAREVSQFLGSVPVALVNDLEAVGLLLPHLQPTDVAHIGDPVDAALIGNRISVKRTLYRELVSAASTRRTSRWRRARLVPRLTRYLQRSAMIRQRRGRRPCFRVCSGA